MEENKTVRINIKTKKNNEFDFKLPFNIFKKLINKVKTKQIKINGVDISKLLEGVDIDLLINGYLINGDIFVFEKESGDKIKIYVN